MTQAAAFTPTLQSALKVEGIAPPSSLPQTETAQIQALGNLSGSAFDRQYVDDELAIHKRAVSVLQKEDAALPRMAPYGPRWRPSCRPCRTT